MKKVGYILRMFPKISETFIQDEIKSLKDKGLDLMIFSLATPTDKIRHPGVEDLEKEAYFFDKNWKNIAGSFLFFIFHPISFLKNYFKYVGKLSIKNFLKAAAIARLVRKNRISHLHAHFADYPTTITALVSALSKRPFSFTAHAFDIFINQKGLCEKVAKSKFIITVSKYNREFINEVCGKKFQKKIKIVHAGIEPEFFKSKKTEKSEIFTIVSVGQFISKKGFRYLLAALSLVKDRGLKFQCNIIGKGPQLKILKKLRKEFEIPLEVDFVGEKTKDEVREFLNQAHLFILPSIITKQGDRDSIPVVLMEAMSLELPVISSDIVGIPELVTEESGTLIRPKDYRRLAWEIEQFINMEPEERHKIGLAGRKKVMEDFNINKEADKLIELFSE